MPEADQITVFVLYVRIYFLPSDISTMIQYTYWYFQLAERGVKVTLIEAKSKPAQVMRSSDIFPFQQTVIKMSIICTKMGLSRFMTSMGCPAEIIVCCIVNPALKGYIKKNIIIGLKVQKELIFPLL